MNNMTVEQHFVKELKLVGLNDIEINKILVHAKKSAPKNFQWHERLLAYPSTLLVLIQAIINQAMLKFHQIKLTTDVLNELSHNGQ